MDDKQTFYEQDIKVIDRNCVVAAGPRLIYFDFFKRAACVKNAVNGHRPLSRNILV